MCGIAGLMSGPSGLDPGTASLRIERMSDSLAHRGPNGSGTWVAPDGAVALGHRRLSVIDPSEAGTQPMRSACGRFLISFNGEIYNYTALREALGSRRIPWRGHSDTEVLLESLAHQGVDRTLEQANGMYAFALWDDHRKVLTLARDRLGQKPLYYGWAGDQFVFASQLSALRTVSGFDTSVADTVMPLYLHLGVVPAPWTIHPEAWKLPPGHLIEIGPDDIMRRSLPAATPYWSCEAAARAGLESPWDGSSEAAVDELERRLCTAIDACRVSDVPLGAFLSGGIDSTLVVALLQSMSTEAVRTFSIGFPNRAYDEADHARAVASHLGTDHTELTVTEREAQQVIPDLGAIYDEPFADASQLPTCLVARLARQQVTVCLSGDGGDEAFAGYNRHVWADPIARLQRQAPLSLRRSVAAMLVALPFGAVDRAAVAASALLPSRMRLPQAGEKLVKFAGLLACRDEEESYRKLVAHWPLADTTSDGAAAVPFPWTADESVQGIANRWMLRDQRGYLPDDILVKLDRATMAVGLEGRAPLIDHDVIEFAWRIPAQLKMRDGRGKWPLREVLRRHVPAELTDRPKTGFAAPIHQWLRGDLRDWADDLLSPARLRQTDIIDGAAVARLWQQHRTGSRNAQYMLWPVLMFEAWRDAVANEPEQV